MAKPNRSEKIWFSRLFEYGCIVCNNEFNVYSAPEIHHLRAGCGTGQRASHYRTIPLCPPHHRTGGYGVAIHAGRKMWEEIYGTEEGLLVQVENLLSGDYS